MFLKANRANKQTWKKDEELCVAENQRCYNTADAQSPDICSLWVDKLSPSIASNIYQTCHALSLKANVNFFHHKNSINIKLVF